MKSPILRGMLNEARPDIIRSDPGAQRLYSTCTFVGQPPKVPPPLTSHHAGFQHFDFPLLRQKARLIYDVW
jgi:hypothetical protein